MWLQGDTQFASADEFVPWLRLASQITADNAGFPSIFAVLAICGLEGAGGVASFRHRLSPGNDHPPNMTHGIVAARQKPDTSLRRKLSTRFETSSLRRLLSAMK